MIQSGISNIFKKFTLMEIGNATGNRDHTTIINAKRHIRNLCDTEPEIKETYEKYVSLLILIANGKKVA
jgi:chromosomal replication initiation ATPase DnaA